MSTEQRSRRPSPALSVGANATFFTVVFIFKDPTPVFNQRLLLSLKHPGVWLSRARFVRRDPAGTWIGGVRAARQPPSDHVELEQRGARHV